MLQQPCMAPLLAFTLTVTPLAQPGNTALVIKYIKAVWIQEWKKNMHIKEESMNIMYDSMYYVDIFYIQ